MTWLQATCIDCGRVRKVRRHELDRAKQPKCLACGGALELSQSAQDKLGKVQSAQQGQRLTDARRKPTKEEPARLIPRHESKRYVFWEHPDIYRTMIQKDPEKAAELKSLGPVAYYQKIAAHRVLEGKYSTDERLGMQLLNDIEETVYRNGRPYYKVWPSIAEALCHTEMRVDGEFFKLAYDGFEVRLPTLDNPLTPARGIFVAKLPGKYWQDGRAWSLAIAFTNGDPDDPTTESWMADIPVRPGVSLEDALDQTALQQQCPNPGLARKVMRVVVGVAFFALDKHEVILPDLSRRVIDYYHRERREPTTSEAEKILRQAKESGLFGWRIGSETTLPTAHVNHHNADASGEHRELTCGHVRRGHMAMVPCGEGKKERRLVFRSPCLVRPDLPLTQHGYKIKV